MMIILNNKLILDKIDKDKMKTTINNIMIKIKIFKKIIIDLTIMKKNVASFSSLNSIVSFLETAKYVYSIISFLKSVNSVHLKITVKLTNFRILGRHLLVFH